MNARRSKFNRICRSGLNQDPFQSLDKNNRLILSSYETALLTDVSAAL